MSDKKPEPVSPPAITVRYRELCALLGVSRTTVYRMRREDPTFPRPIRLSAGIEVWRIKDLQAWIAKRPTAA